MLILIIFCQDIFVNFFNNVLERSVLERSRTISQKMFSLVPGDVLCDRDEVFEVFVDSDVSMSKDAYLALVALSS